MFSVLSDLCKDLVIGRCIYLHAGWWISRSWMLCTCPHPHILYSSPLHCHATWFLRIHLILISYTVSRDSLDSRAPWDDRKLVPSHLHVSYRQKSSFSNLIEWKTVNFHLQPWSVTVLLWGFKIPVIKKLFITNILRNKDNYKFLYRVTDRRKSKLFTFCELIEDGRSETTKPPVANSRWTDDVVAGKQWIVRANLDKSS